MVTDAVGAAGTAGTALTVFFFNDTATTEIYALSLHDALPISGETPANVGDSWKVPPSRLYSNPAPTGAVITMVAVGIAHVGCTVARAHVAAPATSSALTPSFASANTQELSAVLRADTSCAVPRETPANIG